MSQTSTEMLISPLAGKLSAPEMLINVSKLITAYYRDVPDPTIAQQRVAFGTSGHRGSSFELSFNEAHVLAITHAICYFRKQHGINGPLFLGIDTHALSEPAFASALEVLAANSVDVMIAKGGEYTPTPAISHAILCYNRNRTSGLADGIVITPSHNPPDNGGFKYNGVNGGPADTKVTDWIEWQANHLLENNLRGVLRVSYEKALKASTTHTHDYLNTYVNDLENVIDMQAIRSANIQMGVDPLGGAGVHYWPAIAEHYKLDLTVVNSIVDSTFRFMSLDWDGQIRMDPSSSYAMQPLIDIKDRFDIAFACDTDHDRHGIVTAESGLMPSNHYLSVAIDYLFKHRPDWPQHAAIGKTVVTSQMIDRVSARLARKVIEVPVGFKWFSSGLLNGSLAFAGEESAGASFLRCDGNVWTTDKDGLVLALLSAEITAKMGLDPAVIYRHLTEELGEPVAKTIQMPISSLQKQRMSKLSYNPEHSAELAGESICSTLTRAPGNDVDIGGLKVQTEHGWFAARPSGTENIFKLYAESFLGKEHLNRILNEAQKILDTALPKTIN